MVLDAAGLSPAADGRLTLVIASGCTGADGPRAIRLIRLGHLVAPGEFRYADETPPDGLATSGGR